MHIIQLPLRALQIIFSAVALALSVVLIKGQLLYNAPAVTNYEAFCGAFGIIVAFIGIAAALIEAFPGFVMAAIDGLCTLFFLAGSIAFAAKLGVHSCSADPGALRDLGLKNVPGSASPYTIGNEIINAGSYCEDTDCVSRCREAQADTAFLFFAFACFIGSLVFDFVGGSSGGMGRRNQQYV